MYTYRTTKNRQLTSAQKSLMTTRVQMTHKQSGQIQ